MKNLVTTYISILCLILILISQVYIVVDYYHLINESLKREINVVMDDAYHTELNLRQKSRVKGSKILAVPPIKTSKNTVVYNFDKMQHKNSINKNDVMAVLNTAINDYISKEKPLNIRKLDSITSSILHTRGIESDFVIRTINPTTNNVLESSKKSFAKSQFLIYSKVLPLDFENKKSLQLILLNPLTNIFKRMGTLLIGSFLLSLFCFYGIWFLFRTQARQKKLMAVKNDFFGNTAHELKRPVAQLHLALEALSRPGIDENKAKKERYLTISKEATKDMSEKITMIMTLSMAEEGVFKLNYSDFNLLEEVRKLKEQFSAITEKDISIEIENTDADIQIKADKDHLRQCIANLIDNAIKYSGVPVRILIRINRMKDLLRLSVQDNGIGINPEKLSSVFEKYTRLNTASGSPSGFGIGLSYVKTVVEKHAGHIEVQSEPGKGSEFILSLPV